MKKILLFAVLALFVNKLCISDEIRQPREPRAPLEPRVPENTDAADFPGLPAFPPLPPVFNRPDQNTGSAGVRELERRVLRVSEAFPNGDTRRNLANTIHNAQYVLYSDESISLELNFTSGAQYMYHLSNPRGKTEVNPGVFRITYDTIVQAGREFLLEP